MVVTFAMSKLAKPPTPLGKRSLPLISGFPLVEEATSNINALHEFVLPRYPGSFSFVRTTIIA